MNGARGLSGGRLAGVLNRHGYRKESRVGYSIGLGFPPDWGERTASLRPGGCAAQN